MTNRNGPADQRHVFTYGSLMFEPVWRWAVSNHYPSVSAKLEGFRRFAVRDEHYPAAVRSATAGAQVQGRLYLGVSGPDLKRLDEFEGSQYERITVEVEDLERGARWSAEVYLFLREDLLLATDWDVQRFADVGLAKFMRTYCPTT